jgi:hypothetical protein
MRLAMQQVITVEFKCQLPLPSIEKRGRAEMCQSRFETTGAVSRYKLLRQSLLLRLYFSEQLSLK